MREKTYAHRFFEDDIPLKIKNDRIIRINDKLREIQNRKYKLEIGKLVD